MKMQAAAFLTNIIFSINVDIIAVEKTYVSFVWMRNTEDKKIKQVNNFSLTDDGDKSPPADEAAAIAEYIKL